MFGLFSPSTLALVGLYGYVGYHAYRAGRKAGKGVMVSLTQAATWPLTMWKVVNDLYRA